MKSLFIVFILIVGLAFFGCASTPQVKGLNDFTDEEIEAYNNDPNNIDKIVCREEKQIGTRVPKRVCHKQSTIDKRARQDQGIVQDIHSESTHYPIPEGGN